MSSLYSYGTVLCDNGEWEATHELFIQIYEVCKSVLGENHPRTLSYLCKLANSCNEIRQFDNALKYGNQAYAMLDAQIQGNHPDKIIALHSIAEAYKGNNNPEKAQKYFLLAHEMSTSIYGESHHYTREISNIMKTIDL